MQKKITVAIDGPAGAGKSTVARAVADKLGFVYVDTGAMYRAVALWAIRLNVSDSDMHRLEQLALAAEVGFIAGARTVLLNGEDVTEAIRAPEVSTAASRIAAVPAVRRALVDKQRHLTTQSSVVMEGRDIGSVVFPDAHVKVFLDADPQVRTGRRILEMKRRGAAVASDSAAREIAERDHRDRSRVESPLIQAPDAIYLDTSQLTAQEVEETLLKLIRDRTANGKEYSR